MPPANMNSVPISAARPGKIQCQQCGRSFSNPGELGRHITRTHPNRSPATSADEEDTDGLRNRQVCGMCEAGAGGRGSIWNHIRTVHLQLPQNLQYCPVCARLVDKSERDSHMARMHPEVICHTCTKSFPGYKSYFRHFYFTRHYLSKCGKQEATCGLCEYSWSDGKSLMMHIVTCHLQLPRKQACNFCGLLISRDNFDDHLQNDHPEVICLICGAWLKQIGWSMHVTTAHYRY